MPFCSSALPPHSQKTVTADWNNTEANLMLPRRERASAGGRLILSDWGIEELPGFFGVP